MATKNNEILNYETALEELQALVTALEAGKLPLESVLQSYQRGAELLAFCRSKLQALEKQIEVIDVQVGA